MNTRVAGGAAVALMFAATSSLLAHHSLARFDTTTAVRVKGVVVQFAMVNPHSILYVDEKRTDGQTRRWAVEGPAVNQLARRGIAVQFFEVGAIVEACGYTLKDEFDVPRPTSTSMSGQVLAGEDLAMPDGKRLSWGDYGIHKCHRQDDPDLHPNYPLR